MKNILIHEDSKCKGPGARKAVDGKMGKISE